MSYTIHRSQVHTIRQEDPNFTIQDGITITPRAGFEISNDCPRQYKLMIIEAIKNGWLQPVASVTERELIFAGLTK
jgi:hypothetical protein